MNRRDHLKSLAFTGAAAIFPPPQKAATFTEQANTFIYCLNMATIKGHNLGFIKELETASKAGYGAVEIWIDLCRDGWQKAEPYRKSIKD